MTGRPLAPPGPVSKQCFEHKIEQLRIYGIAGVPGRPVKARVTISYKIGDSVHPDGCDRCLQIVEILVGLQHAHAQPSVVHLCRAVRRPRRFRPDHTPCCVITPKCWRYYIAPQLRRVCQNEREHLQTERFLRDPFHICLIVPDLMAEKSITASEQSIFLHMLP